MKDSLGRRRHDNQNFGGKLPEPGDGAESLELPEGLGDAGREAWHRAVEWMRETETLDSSDEHLLREYGRLHDDLERYRIHVETHGPTLEGTSALGHRIDRPNPCGACFGALASARAELRALSALLGFGAKNRAALGVRKNEELDPFEVLAAM